MALEVSGKTAIITGAGSGINLAFAQLLLRNNCNAIFADISLRPEAEETLSRYSGNNAADKDGDHHHSARAIFHPTDVTDWVQLSSVFEKAEKTFGHADIICPGAGIYDPPFSNFWLPPGTPQSRDSPTGHHYASVDINITHPIRMTQLAISHFLKHKVSGVVVHISSIAAQKPHLPCPIYVAGKHAVSGFVRSLAKLENPDDNSLPKIRVNAVAPGVIKTPLWTERPEIMKWVDASMDDWTTPEEVAEVMLNCVIKPEYVGGSVIEVGRGQTRFVQNLNDPGPKGAGHTTSSSEFGDAQVWERLAQSDWGQ